MFIICVLIKTKKADIARSGNAAHTCSTRVQLELSAVKLEWIIAA